MNHNIIAATMADQLRVNPETSNAIWVTHYKDADWIHRFLRSTVKFYGKLIFYNQWDFDIGQTRRDPNFRLFIGNDSGHVGARISGLLLVEPRVETPWEYIVTSAGRWELIS